MPGSAWDNRDRILPPFREDFVVPFEASLFPAKPSDVTPIIVARRNFLTTLLQQRQVVESAIEQLLNAKRRREGREALNQPFDAGSIRFAAEMMNRLAICWRAYRTTRPASLKGLPKKQLDRLVKKLEKLSDTIETVNAGAYDSPIRAMGDEASHIGPKFSKIREDLHEEMVSLAALPRLLLLYAEQLSKPRSTRWKVIRDARSGEDLLEVVEWRQHRDLVLDSEMNLLKLIESRTGSPHFEQSATLLEATFSAVPRNERRRGRRQFDADSLRERRSRYKKAMKRPVVIWDGGLLLLAYFNPEYRKMLRSGARNPDPD